MSVAFDFLSTSADQSEITSPANWRGLFSSQRRRDSKPPQPPHTRPVRLQIPACTHRNRKNTSALQTAFEIPFCSGQSSFRKLDRSSSIPPSQNLISSSFSYRCKNPSVLLPVKFADFLAFLRRPPSLHKSRRKFLPPSCTLFPTANHGGATFSFHRPYRIKILKTTPFRLRPFLHFLCNHCGQSAIPPFPIFLPSLPHSPNPRPASGLQTFLDHRFHSRC